MVTQVAFGSDFRAFEGYLKVLSERTGGEHHVSSLNGFDLCRAFGTIASSITTTRCLPERGWFGSGIYPVGIAGRGPEYETEYTRV